MLQIRSCFQSFSDLTRGFTDCYWRARNEPLIHLAIRTTRACRLLRDWNDVNDCPAPGHIRLYTQVILGTASVTEIFVQ
ncbi:hypothetical protein RvY_05952 [Ramazzottius varieornatus]|uniref:Uncharacterized protein n=1 Tax=Ramazzottius varieornatus TaxID=947166 RepID=A0A1D1V5Q8_RAMVA|nr:hypothetical protein RvY_05952 [Ramazzottius varieornatus]